MQKQESFIDLKLNEIVLCDINLPGELTGHDVARLLRQTHPSAFLAALTGYSLDEGEQTGEFHRYLTKPVDPDVLQRLLQNASAR